MKALNSFAFLCAATAFALPALPAAAAWDRVGSVEISQRPDRDRAFFNFGGSVEALQLMADGSDVYCRSVRSTFANGRTREIFSGTLRRGRSVNVNLPGNDRNIRRLDFDCRAEARRGARIHVTADVGRYRDEWRRNPDWDRLWSRIFPGWGPIAQPNQPARWTLLGTQHFEGRRDSESLFTGWRGRDVRRIALKPLEADARCTRVSASFANGRSRVLNIQGGDRLRRGTMNVIDLPGHERNIRALSLSCRADHARRVSIQILAD